MNIKTIYTGLIAIAFSTLLYGCGDTINQSASGSGTNVSGTDGSNSNEAGTDDPTPFTGDAPDHFDEDAPCSVKSRAAGIC